MDAPDPISGEADWDGDSGFHKAVWTKLAYCTTGNQVWVSNRTFRKAQGQGIIRVATFRGLSPCLAHHHHLHTVSILRVCPDLSQGGLSQGPTPMTSFNFNFLFKDLSPNTITLKKHISACKWVTPFKERDQTGRRHPRHPGSGQDILMELRGMVQPQASSKFNVDTV